MMRTLWSLDSLVFVHGWGVRITNFQTIVSVCICGWLGPARPAREEYPRVGGNSFNAYLDWCLHVGGKEPHGNVDVPVCRNEPASTSDFDIWAARFRPKATT